METIDLLKRAESLKKDFASKTGRELPVFKYNGKLGILYDVDAAIEFVPLDEVLSMKLDYDDVKSLTYESDCAEYGEEITDATIHDGQKLLFNSVWSSVDYQKSDEYVRELCVTTNSYYDWTSSRKLMLNRIESASRKELEELRAEWEDIVSQYSDPLGFEEWEAQKADFDSLIQEADRLCD